MLNYRHAFHAGNYADVLKHWVLVEVLVLSYLNSKETPWAYLDTHAGGGVTDLDSAYARKLGKYRASIGKLPPPARCCKLIRAMNSART